MKRLIVLLILFIGLFYVHFAKCGEWYAPVGKIGADTTYKSKAICEEKESHECYNVVGKDLRYYVEGQVDDKSKPKYQKRNVQSCSDENSCQALHNANDCTQYDEHAFSVINENYTEVYCAVPNGYEQKPGLVENAALKTAAETDDQYKLSQKVNEIKIQLVKKQMDCGKDVMALLSVRNVSKSLTFAQKKSIIGSYADIRSFLEVGDLNEAKTLVQAVVPDGVIVTQADKDAIIEKLDACLVN